MKIKKNKLWIFDPDEIQRRWKKYGEEVRILQVFNNPDQFGFGRWDIDEIAAVGRTVIYIVMGVDPRDGSRSKCAKFAVMRGETEEENEEDLEKAIQQVKNGTPGNHRTEG